MAKRFLRILPHGIVLLLLLVAHTRTGGMIKEVAAVGSRSPPVYYAYRLLQLSEEIAGLVVLIKGGIAFVRAGKREPDYSAVDWRSLKGACRAITHPPHNHGKGTDGKDRWSPGGLLERLDDVESLIQKLRVCDPENVSEIVSAEWGNYGEEKQRRLSYALDGEDDVNDWLRILYRKRRKLIDELVSLTGGVAEWHSKNAPMIGYVDQSTGAYREEQGKEDEEADAE